jgi:hypothetical protein
MRTALIAVEEIWQENKVGISEGIGRMSLRDTFIDSVSITSLRNKNNERRAVNSSSA